MGSLVASFNPERAAFADRDGLTVSGKLTKTTKTA
jgi:hypothetical protein